MKPGRKSFGRVRVDALDAWMMVTTKAGWKTAVGFLITLKKHENDSGPLTVSVLFRARRHSREISQDLRSRMNLSSSVMAASTHTSFPRVRVNISATKKEPWKNQCTVEESMHCGRISAPWRRRQLVDGLRNHHDRDVHHSEHVSSPGRKALHHDSDIHPPVKTSSCSPSQSSTRQNGESKRSTRTHIQRQT